MKSGEFSLSQFLTMRSIAVSETAACADRLPTPIWIDVSKLSGLLIGKKKYLILKPDACVKLGGIKTNIIWDFPGVGKGERELNIPAQVVRIATYKLRDIPSGYFKKIPNDPEWRRAVRESRHKLRLKRTSPHEATNTNETKLAAKKRWSVVFYETPVLSPLTYNSLLPDRLSFAKKILSGDSEDLVHSGALKFELDSHRFNFDSLPTNKNARIIFQCSSKNTIDDLTVIAKARQLGWRQIYWYSKRVEQE